MYALCPRVSNLASGDDFRSYARCYGNLKIQTSAEFDDRSKTRNKRPFEKFRSNLSGRFTKDMTELLPVWS